MSWHLRRLAAFDIETTGIDPCNDRIVTAAVSLAGDGRATESHAWLVDPRVEIPEGAAAVHGITTAHAREHGSDCAEAIEEITALLAAQLLDGVPVVAFNARFDLTCLDREARRHGIEPLVDRVGGPDGLLVVDPFVLDKQFDRFRRGKRTLGAVCEHYRVRLDAAHDANADAVAAARVAFRLAQRIEELRETELRALHAQQVAWAAEQAVSLQAYFREQGKDEVVEREWPIVWVAEPVTVPEPALVPETVTVSVAVAAEPEPVAVAEPVLAAEPEPVAVAEPVLAAEPEPVAVAEPVLAPEPEPVAVAEPVLAREPEPVAVAESLIAAELDAEPSLFATAEIEVAAPAREPARPARVRREEPVGEQPTLLDLLAA